MKHIFHRILAAVLVLGMMMTTFAGAADTAKGTTLRLEDVSGTVTVQKANGKTVKTKTGSKLYSGYKVSTSAKSYAWISLDDDVLVKLDERSSVSISKSGKKLEVKLSTGSLFFNVSKKLKEGRKLNIRTSSMTTGVRGTSGIVRAGIAPKSENAGSSSSRTVSELVLCEGQVELTCMRPGEGTETTALQAGWQASVTENTPADGSAPAVQVEVKPTSVRQELMDCGFAAAEVKRDKSLQDKLTAGGAVTETDIADIASNADAQLKKDEAQSEKQAEAQQSAAEAAKQQAEKENGASSKIENTFPASSSGSSSSGSSSGGSSSPSQPEQTKPETVTVTFVRGEEIVTQTVEKGKAAVRPAEPATGGRWMQGDAEYDFAQPVNESLTLRWVEDAPDPEPDPQPEPKQQFIVTFLDQSGRRFARQTVEEGQTAVRPALHPTKSGAWTLDGRKYDFTQPVSGSLTLRWTAE